MCVGGGGVFFLTPQWGTVDAEIKVSSVENPEPLKVLSLKPREGQNTALHAPPTARNFCLSNLEVLLDQHVGFYQ